MVAPLNSKWIFLPTVAVLLLAGLLLRAYRHFQKGELDGAELYRLPLVINGWEGREIQISKRNLRMLGTKNVLFRQYRKNNQAINLYILESSANRASFHPPEYCYVAGRTEMIERSDRKISWGDENAPVKRCVFQGPGGKYLVYYCYSFGRQFVSSYCRQQLLIISNLLRNRTQPSLLIRLSVEGEFELERGDEIIRRFVGETFGVLTDKILTGRKPPP